MIGSRSAFYVPNCRILKTEPPGSKRHRVARMVWPLIIHWIRMRFGVTAPRSPRKTCCSPGMSGATRKQVSTISNSIAVSWPLRRMMRSDLPCTGTAGPAIIKPSTISNCCRLISSNLFLTKTLPPIATARPTIVRRQQTGCGSVPTRSPMYRPAAPSHSFAIKLGGESSHILIASSCVPSKTPRRWRPTSCQAI